MKDNRNVLKGCDIPGCGFLRQGFGRFCQVHDRKEQRTGHPLGTNLLKRELRPYLKLSTAFVRRNVDHPGISAATEWITQWACTACPVTPHRHLKPHLWTHNFRHRFSLQAVEPQRLLSTVFAIYLYREHLPRRFTADRHFNHQVAIAVAKLAPGTDRRGWATADVPVRARDHLSQTLNGALAVLAMRAAEVCLKQIDCTETTTSVAGSSEPFTDANLRN